MLMARVSLTLAILLLVTSCVGNIATPTSTPAMTPVAPAATTVVPTATPTVAPSPTATPRVLRPFDRVVRVAVAGETRYADTYAGHLKNVALFRQYCQTSDAC